MLQRRSSSSCCAVHGASIGLSWAGNGPLYDSWTLTGVHIRLFLVTRRANDHGGFYFRTVPRETLSNVANHSLACGFTECLYNLRL